MTMLDASDIGRLDQEAIERVACETSGVDDGVGEIMAALKRLGLDDNTLVVYAADQGWMVIR